MYELLPRWAQALVDFSPLMKPSTRLLTYTPHKLVTDLQFIRTMLETPPRMKFTLFRYSANTVRYWEKEGSASTASLHQKTKWNKVLFLQCCTDGQCLRSKRSWSSSLTSDKIGISALGIFYRSQKAASKGKGFQQLPLRNLTEGTESHRFQKWKLMENDLTLTQVNWTWESLFKDKGVIMPFPNLWAIAWPLISFF